MSKYAEAVAKVLVVRALRARSRAESLTEIEAAWFRLSTVRS